MLFEFYFVWYLGCSGKEKRYKWSIRKSEDIGKDRETFAKDLKNALDRRLSNVQKDETLAILEIFDAQTPVKSSAGKCQLENSLRYPKGRNRRLWHPRMRATLICYCGDETYPGI